MPRIDVDDEVFAAMQAEATAFVDRPNDVLRRRFGLSPASEPDEPVDNARSEGETQPEAKRSAKQTARRRSRRRAPRGKLLPESSYEEPILSVLAERGGEAPAREVTDAVERLIGHQLTPLDRERTSSGEIRWRNRTQFARLALVKRGLIDRSAPRGLWRLTEKGRAAAARAAR
jgi:Mrr N-terminal domain